MSFEKIKPQNRMKKLITLVLLLAAFVLPATAQSQQDLINAYRNGTLTQSQIDNLKKQYNQRRNRWIVSYSDFTTILLALFMMLYICTDEYYEQQREIKWETL